MGSGFRARSAPGTKMEKMTKFSFPFDIFRIHARAAHNSYLPFNANKYHSAERMQQNTKHIRRTKRLHRARVPLYLHKRV
jgi:hypothetical protein